ncbi:hypothetical protein [Pseudolactococcus raffinolactis]|uniref:hypothetical protein n=1 Tax=Pseudolactococcus raffinolactis TaxID=1366 RepID=UPI001C705FA6|nr:hypothetical protein [Lactococcus raffinolactis]
MKAILRANPNWTINDVLDTDVKYLYEFMFSGKKTKKQKVVKPLSDLVKGGN